MKTIGVIGSRRRNGLEDLAAVRKAIIEHYRDGDTFVSGGCPQGGDRFGKIVAAELKAPMHIYPAQWHIYGRSAGFKRNGLIARDADILIACIAGDRRGGTEDTIRKFMSKTDHGVLILV